MPYDHVIIGKANTTIKDLEENKACIMDLNIENNYRNVGYGSLLLNNIENYLNTYHNINYFELIASQNQQNFFYNFYTKHNYKRTDDELNTKFIDDGDNIYELYHFEKKLL